MDDEWELGETSIVPSQKRELTREETLMEDMQTLENEMYHDHLKVMAGVAGFADLDPENIDEIPQKWIEDMGPSEAKRKHRVAKAAWLPNKDAPIAIQTSTKVAVGIIRARATEKAGPKSLNIQMVAMTQPRQQFEVIDVDDEDF
jgi:hypothetical protein